MSIENIKLFFQPRYLFNPYPSYDMKFFSYFLIFFIILVILSIVAFVLSKKTRKLPAGIIWVRLYNWFLWIGIIGLILLFFRFEGIAYISMRFFLFLWMVVFVIWGIYILIYYKKNYKKKLKEYKKKKEKEKYFRKK